MASTSVVVVKVVSVVVVLVTDVVVSSGIPLHVISLSSGAPDCNRTQEESIWNLFRKLCSVDQLFGRRSVVFGASSGPGWPATE